jgi:hypothetical protein
MSTVGAGFQLLLSLIPWLVGLVVGGGFGYFFARWLRPLIAKRVGLRRGLMWIPWRSVIVVLPYLAFFAPIYFGLGLIAGSFIVGIYVFILSIPFTAVTFLNHWFPLPLRNRVISLARMIAVGAISIAAATGIIGGFVAGSQMVESFRILNYAGFFTVFFMVLCIAMLIDLLFGAVQFAFYHPKVAVNMA